MIKRSAILSLAVVGSMLLVSKATEAHHSHASLNKNDVRLYSGRVVRYSWTMPHVFLKIEAPDQDGHLVEYTVELLHPPAMAKRGWSRTSFRPGDRITWEGAHDRDPDRHYTGLNWAETGDGTRLGTDPHAIETVVSPSTDFTGLWKRPEIADGFKPHYRPPEGWPLTAKTRALVDNFDDSQSPLVTCGNPGPPKAMILPYPFMLTRPDDNTIVIERELMKEKRIIHLNGTGEMGPPSSLGFSSGRFDGDQLIVETTNFIEDKWGTHTGIDSSDQKHLVERFWLSDDGLNLHAEITITDPVYLSEPVTFDFRWYKLADRPVIQAPCTIEAAQLYLEAGYDKAVE